jgi:hypothetical protein
MHNDFVMLKKTVIIECIYLIFTACYFNVKTSSIFYRLINLVWVYRMYNKSIKLAKFFHSRLRSVSCTASQRTHNITCLQIIQNILCAHYLRIQPCTSSTTLWLAVMQEIPAKSNHQAYHGDIHLHSVACVRNSLLHNRCHL